jgi:F0F1-type ATP synthase assembly protein I
MKDHSRNRNADLYLVLKIQIIISIILSMLIWIAVSKQAGFSTLVGTAISTITGALMIQILRLKPGDSADLFLGKLMMAESMKFITVIILLTITLIWLPAMPAFVLIGFSVALLAYWIALAAMLMRKDY